MITVTGIHLPDLLSLEDMDILRSQVSPARKEASLKFVRQQDAQRGLIGELLILYRLRTHYHLHNDQIQLDKNKYGKPYLRNHPHIHFNVSHAGNWIVCADGDVPVGIDIEQVRPIDFGIAERFYTQDEYQLLLNAPKDQQLQTFYELWTLKESYIKFVGKGLSLPLDSFSILQDDLQNYQVTSTKPIDTPSFFRHIFIDSHYKLAVCAAESLGPLPLVMLDWTELIP